MNTEENSDGLDRSLQHDWSVNTQCLVKALIPRSEAGEKSTLPSSKVMSLDPKQGENEVSRVIGFQERRVLLREGLTAASGFHAALS